MRRRGWGGTGFLGGSGRLQHQLERVVVNVVLRTVSRGDQGDSAGGDRYRRHCSSLSLSLCSRSPPLPSRPLPAAALSCPPLLPSSNPFTREDLQVLRSGHGCRRTERGPLESRGQAGRGLGKRITSSQRWTRLLARSLANFIAASGPGKMEALLAHALGEGGLSWRRAEARRVLRWAEGRRVCAAGPVVWAARRFKYANTGTAR